MNTYHVTVDKFFVKVGILNELKIILEKGLLVIVIII